MIGWLLFLQEPKWNTRAVQSSLAVMTRDPSGTDGEIENRFRVPASLAHAGGRAGVPETDDAVDGGAARIETFRQSNKDTRASEVNARVKGECGLASTRATRSECVPGVIRARIEARRVYVRKLCPPPRVTCRNARGPLLRGEMKREQTLSGRTCRDTSCSESNGACSRRRRG